VLLAEATFTCRSDNTSLGRSVTGLGDQDGDGHADIVIGAPGAAGDVDAGANGEAFVFYGPLSGTYTTGDVDASWDGVNKNDAAGVGLLGGVDLTGDGRVDLLVGAEGADSTGMNSGVIYLVAGEAL
jgi:hypothetical protein